MKNRYWRGNIDWINASFMGAAMIAAVGSYFWEILWQGIILGLLVVAAIEAPWLWAKIFALVVFLFVIWRFGKNPRHFWKRVAWAALSLLLVGAGLDFTGKGQVDLGQWFQLAGTGTLSPLSPWIALIVIVVAGLFDVAVEIPYLMKRARNGALWASEITKAGTIQRHDSGGLLAKCEFQIGLNGGNVPLHLTKVSVRVKSFLPFLWLVPDEITPAIREADQVHWSRDIKVTLKPDQKIYAMLDFNVTKTWKKRMLFWWTWSPPPLAKMGEASFDFGDDPPRQIVALARFR